MKTVLVKLTDIFWDTDGEDVQLPSDMIVEVSADVDDDNETIMQAAVDKASDQTSWCILSVGDEEILP